MFKLIRTIEDLKGDYIKDFQACSEIDFDIETTGLDFNQDQILLIQVKFIDTVYIIDCLKFDNVKYLMDLIEGSGKVVNGHNIKFDMKFIYKKYGTLFKNVYDTMIGEVLINKGIGSNYYSLQDLEYKYCNKYLDKEERGSFFINFSGVFTQEMLIYASEDVMDIRKIKELQLKTLESQGQLKVSLLESRVLPVVVKMEVTGIKLNTESWLKLSEEAEKEFRNLEVILLDKIATDAINKFPDENASRLFELLSIPCTTKKFSNMLSESTSNIKELLIKYINISSPKQLLSILNNVYGVGINSTNEKELNKFMAHFPIIVDIIKYREQFKLFSSFGDEFLKYIDPTTGKIHATFNQLGTASGRFSSSKPNLQQIVSDSGYRNCFCVDKEEDEVIIGFDYSQQELRVLASLSQDKNMLYAFNNKIDLHTQTASLLYNVPLDQVTKEMRKKGKTLNFAVVYGSTKYGLFKNFSIPLDEGEELIEKFYNVAYPGIRDFLRTSEKYIIEKNMSSTILGRKRFFQRKEFYTDIREKDLELQAQIREGKNHFIQGTSADVTKEAMVNIFYNNPFGDKLIILLAVHDEIVCKVSKDIQKEAYEFIEKSMLDALNKYLKGVTAVVEGYIEPYWSK